MDTVKLTLRQLNNLKLYLYEIQTKLKRIEDLKEAEGFSEDAYKAKRILLDKFFLTDKAIKDMPKDKIDKLFLALVDWYQGEFDNVKEEMLRVYGIEVIA